MTGAPLVTWTVQGVPDLWLGHHNARIVCQAHADAYALEFFEPLSPESVSLWEHRRNLERGVANGHQWCRDALAELDQGVNA